MECRGFFLLKMTENNQKIFDQRHHHDFNAVAFAILPTKFLSLQQLEDKYKLGI